MMRGTGCLHYLHRACNQPNLAIYYWLSGQAALRPVTILAKLGTDREVTFPTSAHQPPSTSKASPVLSRGSCGIEHVHKLLPLVVSASTATFLAPFTLDNARPPRQGGLDTLSACPLFWKSSRGHSSERQIVRSAQGMSSHRLWLSGGRETSRGKGEKVHQHVLDSSRIIFPRFTYWHQL